VTFCDAEGVPPHLRFPSDEFVLCAFAASSLGTLAGTTVRKKLASLKAWHNIHNLEWRGGPRLNLVVNGVSNLAPQSSRKPPRPSVNSTMLSQLIQSLNLQDPLDAAVAACASVAFWAQCRIGELLPTSSSDLSTVTKPSRSNIRRSKRNTHSLVLFLPRTKTKRHGEDVVLTSQEGTSDPIMRLHHHIKLNKLNKHLPLFTYRSRSGPRSLTIHRFLERCNTIWQKLGYPRTTGHCFRIGGTTELLIAGVPPEIVKSMGRWSSDAFFRYWRSLEDIVPQYAQNINMRISRKRKRGESS